MIHIGEQVNRILMKLNLDEINFERSKNAKKIKKEDSFALGEVMYEAYKGTIDYDGETIDEAAEEVKGTLDGKYGHLIDSACLTLENSNRIASAIFFTWFEDEEMPLLTFSMTRVSEKGKGFAKELIKESLMRLKELKYSKCCLFVTEGNEPAISIYKSIGFKSCS